MNDIKVNDLAFFDSFVCIWFKNPFGRLQLFLILEFWDQTSAIYSHKQRKIKCSIINLLKHWYSIQKIGQFCAKDLVKVMFELFFSNIINMSADWYQMVSNTHTHPCKTYSEANYKITPNINFALYRRKQSSKQLHCVRYSGQHSIFWTLPTKILHLAYHLSFLDIYWQYNGSDPIQQAQLQAQESVRNPLLTYYCYWTKKNRIKPNLNNVKILQLDKILQLGSDVDS